MCWLRLVHRQKHIVVQYGYYERLVQVAVPPTIEQGASITIRIFNTGGIRKYAPSYLFGKAVSLDALRAEKMVKISKQAKEDLEGALEALVHQRLNVLISGGTSTGNTPWPNTFHARRIFTPILGRSARARVSSSLDCK